MEAIETEAPLRIGGNLLNSGLITKLPRNTNINVQPLTIGAALTGSREAVYHAAMLEPHTGSELTLDQIRSLYDDVLAARGMEAVFK